MKLPEMKLGYLLAEEFDEQGGNWELRLMRFSELLTKAEIILINAHLFKFQLEALDDDVDIFAVSYKKIFHCPRVMLSFRETDHNYQAQFLNRHNN